MTPGRAGNLTLGARLQVVEGAGASFGALPAIGQRRIVALIAAECRGAVYRVAGDTVPSRKVRFVGIEALDVGEVVVLLVDSLAVVAAQAELVRVFIHLVQLTSSMDSHE